MDDAAIVRLYWDRNEQAIPATAEKYGSYCTAIARNILGSPEDAAAAFMETLPPGTAEHWAGVRKRRLRLVVAAVCLVFALRGA